MLLLAVLASLLPESASAAGLPARAARRTPDPGRAAPFQPTIQPSTLGSPVDCVIIAPDSLADIYQRLADYQTRTGVTTAVRKISTVRGSDPRSNDLAQAVRTFIKAAHDLWGSRWAILAGDHDAIPMRYVRVRFSSTLDIPTDAYYADLDGTWDGNGNGVYGEVADSLDMNPDIAVGRLSAATRAQATTLVSKALRYAVAPIPAPLGKELTLAEVLFPSTWQPGQLVSVDGAVQGESLRVRAPSCATVSRYYENYTAYPGSILLTKATALAALGSGYGVMNHVGHGSRSQISVGREVLTLSDLATLSNGDSIALWISSNCSSAAVDFECVAEEVVRNPAGGALAYVGATRDAWPGVSYRLSTGLMDRLMSGGWTSLGEAVEDARASLLPNAASETQERWGYFETVLLGDPVLPIWRCPPAMLSVTAPATVPLSAGGLAVTVLDSGAPVESALVVAWKSVEDYRTVFTDATGHATVPFHPGSPGAFSLAVSRGGYLPFLDSLAVTGDAPAHFALGSAAIRDSLGGDGDGYADAGELFALGGIIKNEGGTAAAGPAVVSLSAISAGLAVTQGTALLPALGPGDQAPLPDSLRVQALATPNAVRGEMLRVVVSDGVRSDTTEVPIAIAAAAPMLAANYFSDSLGIGGNGNGTLDALETATYRFSVANAGSGRARALSIHALNPGANVTILDSIGSVGDLPPGSAALSPAVRIQTGSSIPADRLFDLRLDDGYGHSWTLSVDPAAPIAPTGLYVEGSGSTRVTISWSPVAAADIAGYRVFRAPDDGSPLAPVAPLPVRRISSYEDEGLSTLTRYRYAVAAVDSGGNEGPRSAELVASTTPSALTGWPAPMGQPTSSSVCLADLDGDGKSEIAVGAEYLYVFRRDGSEWRDGDGIPSTVGIFSTALHNIASSPAAADLDFDGIPELIAASWNDSTVAVWKTDGTLFPGWPRKGTAPFWSAPAVGDIDGDGGLEIVIGSNTTRLFAWHSNGVPVRGSSGVLFVTPGSVVSSPAIADLDHDGTREIIFGTSSGHLLAVHADSSVVWDKVFAGGASSSPAVGDVIPGGNLEVVFSTSADSVYVLTSDGQRAPGWPQHLELTSANGRVPSPALAPLLKNLGDPRLDVIACGTDGQLIAWDQQGTVIPGFASVHLGTGATTEASPAVADLDGDGMLEILIGAEDRRLYAFHADAAPVAGFPIETGAEVRSTPAVWDLDQDGSTEIVLAGWDRSVSAWRYPGTFDASGMAWPMFHHDNWRTGLAGFPILTDVEPPEPPPAPEPPAAPSRAALAQNRPNPFNPLTTIGYAVPGPGPKSVRITVFDVSGRRVATLVSRTLDPGYYEVRWNGRSDWGSDVSSGVYFYRAAIGRQIITRKMALLR